MKIIWLHNKQLNVLGATAVLFSNSLWSSEKVYKNDMKKEKLVMKFKKSNPLEISQVYNHCLFTKPRIFLFG
jgi:hypothetical protein